jgi:hypothetical protein
MLNILIFFLYCDYYYELEIQFLFLDLKECLQQGHRDPSNLMYKLHSEHLLYPRPYADCFPPPVLSNLVHIPLQPNNKIKKKKEDKH